MTKVFLEITIDGHAHKFTTEGTAEDIQNNRTIYTQEPAPVGLGAKWLCVPVKNAEGSDSVAPPTFGKTVCLVNLRSLLPGSLSHLEGSTDGEDHEGLQVTLTAGNVEHLIGTVSAVRTFGEGA